MAKRYAVDVGTGDQVRQARRQRQRRLWSRPELGLDEDGARRHEGEVEREHRRVVRGRDRGEEEEEESLVRKRRTRAWTRRRRSSTR